jgi:hypothetical protein
MPFPRWLNTESFALCDIRLGALSRGSRTHQLENMRPAAGLRAIAPPHYTPATRALASFESGRVARKSSQSEEHPRSHHSIPQHHRNFPVLFPVREKNAHLIGIEAVHKLVGSPAILIRPLNAPHSEVVALTGHRLSSQLNGHCFAQVGHTCTDREMIRTFVPRMSTSRQRGRHQHCNERQWHDRPQAVNHRCGEHGSVGSHASRPTQKLTSHETHRAKHECRSRQSVNDAPHRTIKSFHRLKRRHESEHAKDDARQQHTNHHHPNECPHADRMDRRRRCRPIDIRLRSITRLNVKRARSRISVALICLRNLLPLPGVAQPPFSDPFFERGLKQGGALNGYSHQPPCCGFEAGCSPVTLSSR